ncbi:PaaI family thioesterase [Rhodovibrionaceae bacterium A322]
MSEHFPPYVIPETSWLDRERLSDGTPVERIIDSSMGVQNTFGFLVKVSAGDIELTMTLAEKHLNIADNIHGGVVCTLLDAACSYAVARQADSGMKTPVVTLALNTQFIGTAQQGRLLTRARVIGGGRKTLFAEGEIYSEQGQLLAKANGNWKVMTRRPATEMKKVGSEEARSLG